MKLISFRLSLFAAFSLFIPLTVSALDIAFPGGTVYADAKVREVEGDEVLIEHSGGITRLKILDIPSDMRRELGLKPTMATARADFIARIGELQMPYSKLDTAYQNRLEALETSAKSQGLFEPLLEIRGEIEAFQSRPPLQRFKYPPLVDVRGIYDRELEKLRRSSLAKIQRPLSGYRDELEGVLRELTRNDRIAEATAARAQQDKIIAMIGDPGLALAKFEIGNAIPEASPESATPEGQSELTLCRLVVVQVVDGGDQTPESFAAVEASDFTDFVATGRVEYPHIGGIRKDETIVFWDQGNSAPSVIPGNNVAMYHSADLPIIGLDRDGTLNVGDNGPANIVEALRKQSNVEAVSVTVGAVATIAQQTGKVSMFGRTDMKNVELLLNIEKVRAIEFAGLAFVTVLQDDGKITKLQNGSVSHAETSKKLVKLHAGSIGEAEDGDVVAFGGAPAILSEVGDNPRGLVSTGGMFCALDEDGGFHCSYENEAKQWAEHKDVEKALEGAVAFAPIYARKSRWVVALLPADSVPRSGLWVPAELAKARK